MYPLRDKYRGKNSGLSRSFRDRDGGSAYHAAATKSCAAATKSCAAALNPSTSCDFIASALLCT